MAEENTGGVTQAIAARDFAAAQAKLEQQVGANPGDLAAWLNLAAVRRRSDQPEAALQALHGALRIDPRCFPALLMRASLFERNGSAHEAAEAYGVALAQAPSDERLDAPTLRAIHHARDIYTRHQRQIQDYVRDQTEVQRRDCSTAGRRRLDAFVDTTLRLQRRYVQEPSDYYYPELPAIEFHDRGEFPWLEEFEACGEAILAELHAVLQADLAAFSPYIHYPDHAPLDQWRELNNSLMWTSYNLLEDGRPVPERCARVPNTLAALRLIPQPQVARRSPCALFSLLRPYTHIPPHTGVANFRLLVHLPLILPGNCRFRVGSQTREWRMGEAWVFDDTLEHEAWNDSDALRVILICDTWNPRIPEDERAAIAAVIAATDTYRGVEVHSKV